MKKRIHRFWKSLFNERLDFRERLNRMVLLLAFMAAIIGLGRVLLGAGSDLMYALVPMCVVSGVALHMAEDRQNIKKASWLLVIASNVVLFPAVFILSGGVDSGTPVWFVLGLVYIFLLFDGREAAVALGISLISFLITYFVAYKNPGMIPAASRSYSFMDSYITMVVVSCFVGVLMKIQFLTYNKERI